MDLPKLYDWERIRLALRQLDAAFPGLLQSVVLIGGGAAWFYRESLRQLADADFPVPASGPAEEEIWLSKDVDFMGLTVAEAADLLQTPWDENTHTFHYAGMEVDFLEEGLVLFPAEALRSARQARLPDVTFNVAEAALLYAEKCALLARKARPQDKLHHALLARFLRCEFCRQAESPAALRPSRWIARARDVKSADVNFFSDDQLFNSRLARAIAALNAPDHRALKHWAKHHLPGYNEVIFKMKVTLNWLKQYVDFNWSPEDLTERLTMLGLEVEGVHKIGGEFDGIVVAQVVTRDKHPNADKLSLCRVNDGQGERQIVCGAQNFKAGDKVPLILPGASLPSKPDEKEPFTIKVGKIRGVESHGMLCSPQELGLPDQVDGLLILREDAKVGQPFAEYLGRSGGDVVYDLEVTPNRPDLNSVIGIAREIAAVTGNPLRIPECKIQNAKFNIEDLVSVRIEDAEFCPRYTARFIKGVKIGPSPDWLRSTLEKVGIRSISNVVDVTNYVMLEVGQPLHAFDYHLIAKVGQASSLSQTSKSDDGNRRDACPTIIVRRARAGEKFRTLDNIERTLTSETLLIADEQKGIALAGIMGGANTEINNQTVDVLIESAYFSPTNIRRTSKQLGLRSESSYRFERGADVGICDWASQRAAQLILETAGGELAEGVIDAYPQPVQNKTISLRPEKIKQLLGVEIPRDQAEAMLNSLGLKTAARVPQPLDGPADKPLPPLKFLIPTFRVDLKREVDLIEEITRLYGVDKIPATAPRDVIGSNAYDAVNDQLAEARRILTGLGLNEAQGQTLISSAECGVRSAEAVALANPLSSDMDVLRPSLLPGLIHSLRHNVTRKNYDVALFEVGRVFKVGQASSLPATTMSSQINARAEALAGQAGSPSYVEERRIGIALTGQRNPIFWSGDEREAKFDVSDLKGFVEELLEQFGLRGVTFTRRAESPTLFLESASIALGGKLPLGELGQLSPALARKYDLRDAVFLAELNLDQLLARRNATKSFKPLPQFPSIRRDVAMLVPGATTHDAVLQAVKQAKPANLETVELFDVFRGKNVPEGQKSLAYAFTYRSPEKTLTDTEVNAAHTKVVEAFKLQLKAAVRE